MDDYLEELLASHEEEQTLIIELENEPSHSDDAIEIQVSIFQLEPVWLKKLVWLKKIGIPKAQLMNQLGFFVFRGEGDSPW